MKSRTRWIEGAFALSVLASVLACNGIGGQSTSTPPTSDMVFAGCYAPGATIGNAGCGLASTLGDPNSDATFQAEVANQSNFWSGIPADVHYWNDCQSPNSVSLPSGDVLYGVNLFQQLVSAYGGDAAPISGVLAHEWAHQIQFGYGWFTSNEPTARPIELEADAFSGYYMALGESYAWTSVDDYFSALASLGDYNFNDPSHHGTPQERLAAAQLGFQTAIQQIETNTPLTYADLHATFSSAIGGFSARRILPVVAVNSVAGQFLARLDESQIISILNGESHGKNVLVPVGNHEHLFPKK